MSGLIWIQTVLHFDGIPERIFRKGSIRKKSADDKKCAKLQMYHNLLSNSLWIISFQKVDND